MAIINGVGRFGVRSYVAASVTTYPSSLKLFIDAGNPLSYPGTGTTVTDLAGTQNGTLINGTSYSSANGGSFTFDGINDYITFGTNTAIKPTSQGTISIMAKFTSPYTGYLIANNGGTGRNGFAFLQDSMGSGPIRWYIANGSTYQIGSATNQYEGFGVPPQADIWNLFTLTWDGTTIKTYLNGVLKYQTAQSIQVTTSAYPTLLGNYTTSGGYPLKGNISYLKIYDTAITQTQLTSDFNEIKTRYGFTSYTTRTAAFATATGITDTTILNALNTFDTGLISNGLDTKMKALYPFVGGTSTTHKFNFMNAQDTDAAFRLTFNGGWIHSSTGALPNGTNAFADTFLKPSTSLALNSGHLSTYLRNHTTKVSGDIGSQGNSYCTIWTVWDDGKTYYSFNSGDEGVTYTTTNKFHIVSRTTSNVIKLYRNNAITIGSNTSQANDTSNIYIGSVNYGRMYHSDRESAFASIGDGLTDAEASTFYNLVQALQTSLSRQV